ncbi:hypothetical protein JE943_000139 [Flavobacterium psychrophilum]|nr:hypothetical protein [Flavobacterium psychrophilum]
MKHKYILEIYDNIIREIKNPKQGSDDEIINFIKEWSSESYLIYQVNFIKQNGRIGFKANNPIHNLHPEAAELNVVECETIPEFKELVPQIMQELSIEDLEKNYRWSSENENNTLFILVKCQLEDLSFENRFFIYCYHLLKNENDKIIKLNKERVFRINSKEKIEHYIHRKQYALGNLAHLLIKEINPANSLDIYQFSSNCDKIDCLKITYIYLEKLLCFIEKEYCNYLNVNIQIPYRSILVKEFEITEKLNYVKSRLLACNINERLLKLAYEPLLKIATIKIQEKLTYYEFNYCLEFIAELYKQFKLKNDETSEAEIKEYLFDLNFNSLHFFDTITDDITKELERQENNIEKIDTLYRLLKNYNQKQTRNFMRFNEKLPSIKEQTISWIEEEIEYLTKKIKLQANQILPSVNTEAKIKFLTGLSVAQLSYFFGLLIQTGIVKHKNQRDIFRFISDNFKTNITNTISVDSLNSKYYNVETATKKAVREKIIELLNLTKF